MSLIIAANLSDRVYIAADTRLSKKEGDHYKTETDYQLKIAPISNHILLGCAGSGNMSSYVAQKLRASTDASAGIRDLRKNIEDSIGLITYEYLTKYHPDSPSSKRVAMIFVGSQPKAVKNVEFTRFRDLLGEFQDMASKKLTERFNGKSPNDFTDDEKREFSEIFFKYRNNQKECLAQALIQHKMKDGWIEVPVQDTHVFALEIDCNEIEKEKIFKFIDVPWGNYIVRGAGWTEEQISRDLMWGLEFGPNNGILEQDTAYLIDEILGKYSPTVGGYVISYGVINGTITFHYGDLYKINPVTHAHEQVQSTRMIKDKLHAEDLSDENEVFVSVRPTLLRHFDSNQFQKSIEKPHFLFLIFLKIRFESRWGRHFYYHVSFRPPHLFPR